MGYLSCNAESAILASNPQTQKPQTKITIQKFNYKELETATNGFSDQKLLGRGSHGLVYKAVLRNGRHVAVKKPNNYSQNSPHEVENEIEILAKIQNPRLVNLVGFSADSKKAEKKLLVVEFMSNGNLDQLLHSARPPPNWGRRIRFALQTAQAIHTLHSANPTVIHRDIKSANVMIDGNFNARLGDFGLALRCHGDGYHLKSTPPAGTMGYLDPGYVTPDNLSTKTDVFSFGILLLEIISGRKAIDVNYSPPSIVDWAIPLIRKGKLLAIYDPRIEPPKDPSMRKHLAVIAAKCVRSCRERRPSMNDVVECLTVLTKLVPLHSWNGLTNPCLMVEAIGMPVPSNNTNIINNSVKDEEQEGELGASPALRRSRKVYSDLDFRNNLMDFIIGADKANESRNVAKKLESGRSRLGRDNTNIFLKER